MTIMAPYCCYCGKQIHKIEETCRISSGNVLLHANGECNDPRNYLQMPKCCVCGMRRWRVDRFWQRQGFRVCSDACMSNFCARPPQWATCFVCQTDFAAEKRNPVHWRGLRTGRREHVGRRGSADTYEWYMEHHWFCSDQCYKSAQTTMREQDEEDEETDTVVDGQIIY